MSRAKVGSAYKHSNGNIYTVIDVVRLKYADQWVDGILYQNDEGMGFCRPREIFEEKFAEVKN